MPPGEAAAMPAAMPKYTSIAGLPVPPPDEATETEHRQALVQALKDAEGHLGRVFWRRVWQHFETWFSALDRRIAALEAEIVRLRSQEQKPGG